MRKDVGATAVVGHAMGMRIRRLNPQYRYEWVCRVDVLKGQGESETSAQQIASAEIVAAYGESAYRDEYIGLVSGGHWWQRLIPSLRIRLSNMRARLAERRAAQ